MVNDITIRWDGKEYSLERRAGDVTPAFVVLSAESAIVVNNWLETEPPQTGHVMRLNVEPAKNTDALAKLLGVDYGDQNVFVAELIPNALCPRCGANTGTSEGSHGRCPNCGYEL